MQSDAIEPLMSANEFAQILGVSKRTFECFIARENAPLPIRIGRHRRWRRAEVRAWLDGLDPHAQEAHELKGGQN